MNKKWIDWRVPGSKHACVGFCLPSFCPVVLWRSGLACRLTTQRLYVQFLHVSLLKCHGEEGNGKPPHEIHFTRNSEPCLWFLLRSNSIMQRSFSLCPTSSEWLASEILREREIKFGYLFSQVHGSSFANKVLLNARFEYGNRSSFVL